MTTTSFDPTSAELRHLRRCVELASEALSLSFTFPYVLSKQCFSAGQGELLQVSIPIRQGSRLAKNFVISLRRNCLRRNTFAYPHCESEILVLQNRYLLL